MKVLVTGAAGFIGRHAAHALLARGDRVVGLDNLNDYYDPRLKHDRLARLGSSPGFRFEPLDIADRGSIDNLFTQEHFDKGRITSNNDFECTATNYRVCV